MDASAATSGVYAEVAVPWTPPPLPGDANNTTAAVVAASASASPAPSSLRSRGAGVDRGANTETPPPPADSADAAAAARLAACAAAYAAANAGEAALPPVAPTPLRALYAAFCAAVSDDPRWAAVSETAAVFETGRKFGGFFSPKFPPRRPLAPNAAFLAALPADGTNASLTAIDVSATLVGGGRGAAAVVRLLSASPAVASVNFSGQRLRPAVVSALAAALAAHPSASAVDLRGSAVGAAQLRALLAAATKNTRLTRIALDAPSDFVPAISAAARDNGEGGGGVAPPPGTAAVAAAHAAAAAAFPALRTRLERQLAFNARAMRRVPPLGPPPLGPLPEDAERALRWLATGGGAPPATPEPAAAAKMRAVVAAPRM